MAEEFASNTELINHADCKGSVLAPKSCALNVYATRKRSTSCLVTEILSRGPAPAAGEPMGSLHPVQRLSAASCDFNGKSQHTENIKLQSFGQKPF